MKAPLLFIAAIICLCSCSKMAESILDKSTTEPVPGQFVKYVIRNGQQYCDQSGYKTVETTELKFVVKFDSSAIYQTRSAENQYDINKLFGFSDNNKDHHQFSARFGWRWSEGALRLFAYVYNEGVVHSKELCTVSIGSEVTCSITVASNQYIFSVNGADHAMPRLSTTEKAVGYQLYPYFGGDETAPHDINVWIKTM